MENKIIVIADDSISARALLKHALGKVMSIGYEIFEAKDGLEAVELFKNKNPDIVFMDLTMPNMNGLEALKEIKKMNLEAKVVMVTADRQKETKKELMTDGASDVINKPVDCDELEEICHKMLGQ